MSRVTAVFRDSTQAQAAVQELKNLGIGEQHILLSHHSDSAAQTESSQDVQAAGPTEDGTVNTDTLNDVAVQSANRDLFYIPPNNTMAPAGMGTLGTPMIVPVNDAADNLIATQHMNTGNAVTHDPARETRFYDDALRDGKILISVNTEDSVQEEHARDVLARHDGEFYTR
ncbi:hypothetical protein [Deinococcus cellulosilyticus]|uniref:General stress protein 17M-like domain-containing protein n=1 Tax=Deinococcus cellulosilyticus (strain DSM 18568 / NBRC 106333 / KACC 11606 / 5516J-15) TaxID=1223518 RepID=A0A511N5Q9_DEIC1|nr:hypothetical protein [Deinococcus cellulosilyticus]GEM48200.1 hypothetical protein DC3_38350 [Deinococcus cellulosilyticus NBRC 106333 = KACC 11606]